MGRKPLEVSNLDKALSLEFAQERDQRGWTEAELGIRARMSQSIVHRILSGEYAIKISQASALSEAFGYSLKTFVARAERSLAKTVERANSIDSIDPASYAEKTQEKLSSITDFEAGLAAYGHKRDQPTSGEYAE